MAENIKRRIKEWLDEEQASAPNPGYAQFSAAWEMHEERRLRRRLEVPALLTHALERIMQLEDEINDLHPHG